MTEDIIIGRNPVTEALRAEREIETIFIQQNLTDGPLGRVTGLARDRRIPVRRVPKKKLDEMTREVPGGAPLNHQGVVAKAALMKYASLDDMLSLAEKKGEAPFIIALDGITDPHNLGAIVRSAEVFGAHGVVIPKNRSASMNAAAMKAASGAEEFIPVAKVGNLSNAIGEMKEKGLWIACADMSGVRADKADLKGPLCLVIGSEGSGVSRIVREKCDITVSIEVLGKVDSLNASCAAAVLMYEKRRQTGLADDDI